MRPLHDLHHDPRFLGYTDPGLSEYGGFVAGPELDLFFGAALPEWPKCVGLIKILVRNQQTGYYFFSGKIDTEFGQGLAMDFFPRRVVVGQGVEPVKKYRLYQNKSYLNYSSGTFISFM